MRAQKRKVLVACALLNQTSQPNRGPTHPGLPQNSHAWTPENWRTTARTTQTTSSSTVSSTLKTRNHGAKEVQNEPEHQQAFTNSTASWLHLPPVSRATTTNLQRSALYLGVLDARQFPLVCAAPAQAMPWAVNGLRRVTSIANCAPWCSGNPQANTSIDLSSTGDSHVHVTQFRVAPSPICGWGHPGCRS